MSNFIRAVVTLEVVTFENGEVRALDQFTIATTRKVMFIPEDSPGCSEQLADLFRERVSKALNEGLET